MGLLSVQLVDVLRGEHSGTLVVCAVLYHSVSVKVVYTQMHECVWGGVGVGECAYVHMWVHTVRFSVCKP